MVSTERLKQEQTVTGILRGQRPFDLTRQGAGDLLVKAISVQPEFQRDIEGKPMSAELLARHVTGQLQDFSARRAADPNRPVCNSLVKIEAGDERWYVRLSNYDDGEDMKLLPADQARLRIEGRHVSEGGVDGVITRMMDSILASDPAPWL